MEGATQQDISSEMSVLLCCQRDKEPSGKTPAYFVNKLVFFFLHMWSCRSTEAPAESKHTDTEPKQTRGATNEKKLSF